MDMAAVATRVPRWLHPAPDSMVVRMWRAGQRPKLQAWNLLWSAWAFAAPVFMPVTSAFYWSLLASYPVFLLLFALAYLRPRAQLAYWSMALVLLGCVCMPFNPTAWAYGVFGCVFVPYNGSLRVSALWIALEEAIMLAVAFSLGWPWEIMAILVGISTSSGFGALMGRVSGMKRAAERLSNAEVRRLAANAERERIGRDLHDLLGHTLSLITLKLELSRKLFDRDPERARGELGEAEEVARHALAEVRAAVTGIRATGLAGELASARLMLKTSDVTLRVDNVPTLPDEVDEVLALVLRESVTNIHRHARARHADVVFELAGEHVVMRVGDDGRGGVEALGNGLSGMHERVAAVGGKLGIRSLPGEGTELCVDIPLPAAVGVSPGMSRHDEGNVLQTDASSKARLAGDRA